MPLEEHAPAAPRDARERILLISVAVSTVMLVGKVTAYWITNSQAIFSDAAESLVHGVATLFVLFSFWYSAKPPDKQHPYGHGRIAYFSAGFEGALVFGAALTVLATSTRALVTGQTLSSLSIGFGIAAVLAALNLVLGLALVRIGTRTNTFILIANGKHVLTDVWTTLAAIIGIGLVMLTGADWCDPVAGIVIGCYILYSGYGLLRKSFAGLMDSADSEDVNRLARRLRVFVDDGAILGFHQLRVRRVSDELWIELHAQVPGEMPTVEAHARASRVEQALSELFPRDTVYVMTHVEPADHAAAHPAGYEEGNDPLPSMNAPSR